jgi:anhydro-N-acetylmuramic acid kinase
MSEQQLFIGLMSGTSLDGIDAALIKISGQHCELLDAISEPFEPELYQQLKQLCSPGDNEIEQLGVADRQLACAYAQCCDTLLKRNQLNAQDITAIGCHGQTIRHRPDGATAFTLQIGDPNTLAYLSRITTVCDFRRKDIAAGGQGAPLAPLFHKALLGQQSNAAVVNIGGMANISFFSKPDEISGYDSGPGNVLMDSWIEQQRQQRYDKNGDWAKSGRIDQGLLERLLRHPYFSMSAPKSTGRESFNLNWLEQQLSGHESPQDVQSTLLELTAISITRALEEACPTSSAVYICGGGAYNKQLMLRLEALLHPKIIASTENLGIAPEWLEAACFGWLAHQAINGIAQPTSSITGADRTQVLGGIYPADCV